ncbi:hypothetical protein [Microbacterium sp. 16-032]|uniref:hypothetical protein n=1 Tax=Microbacterium sp. 16-032 TaxID=3239808 RepID=UPI0034E1D920
MDEQDELRVGLQWVGDLISPPSPANQILIMADSPVVGSTQADSHVLMFGYVSPPAVSGDLTPQQVEQLISQPLPVMPISRVVLTTPRLREFRDVINKHLAQTTGEV